MTEPAPPGAAPADGPAPGAAPPEGPRRGRRRRRAVGPPGAASAERVGWDVAAVPPDERPAEDDDARLLRDVPPHHGT